MAIGDGDGTARMHGRLGDGFSDGFVPVEPIDLDKCKTVRDLVEAMGKTSLTARSIGDAAELLYDMATNKDCHVVLTISGIMTVAKQGLIITDLIDRGIVNAVVATGALITHGFVQTAGCAHFKYVKGQMGDKELFERGYDRVYDTLELEKNLDYAEAIVSKVFDSLPTDKPLGSHDLCREFGKYLHENVEGRGILESAYEKNVPVYIPAFTDSELGLDFSIYNRRSRRNGKPELKYDAFADLEKFAADIEQMKSHGIFTIGGGVPRNWAQQVAPYLDILLDRGAQERVRYVRYKYGLRICPEPVEWGGLSGCTYSEGVSWGKFMPESEGGRYVEVLSEATAVLPLIVKAVFERLDAEGVKIEKNPRLTESELSKLREPKKRK
ncbi:MAG: deoxyhypusine synthase family protein [Candidatus ainarchaeum sp.]|nr:deoxyhypusine synthase family protein [Candidatus ainarchaeum sp.]